MKASSPKIPLCVPAWVQTAAFAAGARHDAKFGWYTLDEEDERIWDYLPRRWKYPDRVALMPQMLPDNTWEQNIRLKLTPEKWDAIRQHAYVAAGLRCEICGAPPSPHLECHENWFYDETMAIQKLTGLLSLCPLCHKAHHIGLAGRLNMLPQVEQHLKFVNRWDDRQLEIAMDYARREADERSAVFWTVDLSWLENSAYHAVMARKTDILG
jgi:hypothetical protein